ncbi:hypothetical protein D6825_03580 [Candidatus Woesearchaeota archaeon]|nr:MAG: hypothetical protein D6825_03580 [Candidatus Woesearchaeota archaeon]
MIAFSILFVVFFWYLKSYCYSNNFWTLYSSFSAIVLMFLNFLLIMFSALLGALVGILAGLAPGFHTNLIAVFVLLFAGDAWSASMFLASLAASRSVVDALPTVFLGASDDVLSILPGHELLLKGHGCEAVRFLVAGSFFGAVLSFILAPAFLIAFPFLFSLSRPFIFWILFSLVLAVVLPEGFFGVLVFILSGFFGVLALNSVREPLFPMLSGLFGASCLVLSLIDDVDVPPQYDSNILRVSNFGLFSSLFSGVLACCVMALAPGLGPQQAASLVRVKDRLEFLVLTGALGTVDVVVSIVTFFSVGATRNGAIVAIESLVGMVDARAFVVLLACALLGASVSSIFVVWFSRFYSRLIEFVSIKWLSFAVILLLVFSSLVISGPLGVLVLFAGSAIGLLAPSCGVSRSNCMGCLLVPTLLFLF